MIDLVETSVQATLEAITELLKLQTQLDVKLVEILNHSRREDIRISGVK